MAYTNIDDPSAYFQVALWTGDGNDNKQITNDGNSDLKPDLVWLKDRTQAESHAWFDSSRGASVRLQSNNTNAESTETATLKSFTTDGFTVGTSGSVNNGSNPDNYVAWQWKVNGGTTASNSDGSITSTVQANQDAGFSIITYTGNATNSTVGHGLGVQPSVIINKKRGATASWSVWHSALLGTQLLELNTTGATATVAAIWNSTVPTSSVFSIGTDGQTNSNNTTYVTYAFAEKQGYSKFGSYVGNGNANGSFVYLGFKPAWVMIKPATAVEQWVIIDGTRSPSNQAMKQLKADDSAVEYNGASVTNGIDILSNGFKVRTSRTEINTSGVKYIYMAFAEHPFVTSTGIPTTAR